MLCAVLLNVSDESGFPLAICMVVVYLCMCVDGAADLALLRFVELLLRPAVGASRDDPAEVAQHAHQRGAYLSTLVVTIVIT